MTPAATRQADECKRLAREHAYLERTVCNGAEAMRSHLLRDELYAAIDKLASMIPAGGLAEEARRMDWLESMANKSGGLLLHDGSERGRVGLGLRPGRLSRTLREAIDAAMAASTPQGKETP